MVDIFSWTAIIYHALLLWLTFTLPGEIQFLTDVLGKLRKYAQPFMIVGEGF